MLTPGTIVVVLVVAAVLVGTKRIRGLGEDLGAALRHFRRGLQGETEVIEPESKVKADTPPTELK